MERYKSLFHEAKQVGVLYHFTKPAWLYQILLDNTLYGTFNFKTKQKTISFTRQFDLGLAFARIAVDGNKLSEKYKIEPYHDPNIGIRSNGKKEFEEMIRADQIKNFSNYIIQIDISKRQFLTTDISTTEDLLKREYNFPINLVDSWKPVKLP